MKTFVSEDYQIKLWESGSFEVLIIGLLCSDTFITYSPNRRNEELWAMKIGGGLCPEYKTSQNLSDLWLSTSKLRTLHKALEVIGRQDLMDNEIVFVDKKEEE